MKKQYQYLLIAIAVLVIGAGAWYYFVFRKKKKALEALDSDPPPKIKEKTPDKVVVRDIGKGEAKHPSVFPLRYGKRGEMVKNLQRFLNDSGANPRLKVDGIFGDNTQRAAIKVFGKPVITETIWLEKTQQQQAVTRPTLLERAIKINNAESWWWDDKEEDIYEAVSDVKGAEKKQLEDLFLQRYEVKMWPFMRGFLNDSEYQKAKDIYHATA